MKNILFTLTLLISFSSFGQVTMTELIEITKIDRESFEIFAMNKGFIFYDLRDEFDYNFLIMKTGTGQNTEYLTQASGIVSGDKYSNYQPNKERLLTIYNELKTLGFRLISSEMTEDAYVKTYERGYSEEIIISIYNNSTGCNIDYSN